MNVLTKWLQIFFVVLFICLGSVRIEASNVRILTQKDIQENNGELYIAHHYSLNGEKIELPLGYKLIFSGGSLDNGEIEGNHSYLVFQKKKAGIKKNLKISGTWNNKDVYDIWFEFDESPDYVANHVIENILSMSNDETECHLHFDEPRTYRFELPYKGPTDLGERISYDMVDGKKKRHWYELYDDKFAFLRIFTIPSNTHVTINNHFQMIPTNQGAYFVFWEYDKKNVTIDGKGVISGDAIIHRYETPFKGPKSKYYGEWGMLIQCRKCKNFRIRGITLENAFGDAVVFNGSSYKHETGERFADGFIMENVKIVNARRNGLTLGARNVLIKDCLFEGCGSERVKGTSPRCAIDLEPDYIKKYPEIGNENVRIEKCIFKDNYRDLASYMNNLPLYGKIATTIADCKFNSSVHLQATYWIEFNRCVIPRITNSTNSLSYSQNSRRLLFKDCVFGIIDRQELSSAKKRRNRYEKCKFQSIVEK